MCLASSITLYRPSFFLIIIIQKFNITNESEASSCAFATVQQHIQLAEDFRLFLSLFCIFLNFYLRTKASVLYSRGKILFT